ncbi:MAG: hypothetical protein HZB09_02685 [Candidatus Yonathbacteria bacterium]|nr:hypothetical protein [Candidatus Yonathbacteria bacterium]
MNPEEQKLTTAEKHFVRWHLLFVGAILLIVAILFLNYRQDYGHINGLVTFMQIFSPFTLFIAVACIGIYMADVMSAYTPLKRFQKINIRLLYVFSTLITLYT